MEQHAGAIKLYRDHPDKIKKHEAKGTKVLYAYKVLSEPGWELHFRAVAIFPDSVHFLWRYVLEACFIILLRNLQKLYHKSNTRKMYQLYKSCPMVDFEDWPDMFPIIVLNRALPFCQGTPGKNNYEKKCRCGATTSNRWFFAPGTEAFDANSYECRNCWYFRKLPVNKSKGKERTKADEEYRQEKIALRTDEAVPRECSVCHAEPKISRTGEEAAMLYRRDSSGKLALFCARCYKKNHAGRPLHCEGGCGTARERNVAQRKCSYFKLYLCGDCRQRMLAEAGCAKCGTHKDGNYTRKNWFVSDNMIYCGNCYSTKFRDTKN
jgi:hypothetical protein